MLKMTGKSPGRSSEVKRKNNERNAHIPDEEVADEDEDEDAEAAEETIMIRTIT
jgi:hypothetical protein